MAMFSLSFSTGVFGIDSIWMCCSVSIQLIILIRYEIGECSVKVEIIFKPIFWFDMLLNILGKSTKVIL